MERPSQSEYPEYYIPYVNLVPDGDLVEILENNLIEMKKLFAEVSEEQGHFRYVENKWSIKEVLGHINDTERVMAYRLLRVGRGDNTPLAGFNENQFVEGASSNRFSIQTLLGDFIAVRTSTLALVRNMPEEAWGNVGNANNFAITTRAIAYIIAGHEMHHRNIITDRYLAKF